MHPIQNSPSCQTQKIKIALCIPCWKESNCPSGAWQHAVVMLVMYLHILTELVFAVFVVVYSFTSYNRSETECCHHLETHLTRTLQNAPS